MSAFDYDYPPASGEDQVPAPGTPVAALPATRAFSAQITSSTIGASTHAGGVAQVPAAALEASAPEAPPRVSEVTLNLGPADQCRRFRVLVSPACPKSRFLRPYARRPRPVPLSESVMSSKFCCDSQRNGGPIVADALSPD